MQKKSIIKAIAMAAVFAAGSSVQAQPAGAYFQAVTNLDPAGYWPLNETAQPPAPFSFNNTADNLGSLGAQATGYYGAWYQPSNTTWYITNNIVQAPAVTAPFDNSVGMNCQGLPGQYVIIPRATNGVVNTNLTLTPPFTIEAWVNVGSIANGLLDIVGEGGYVAVNYGGPNTNDPFYGGPGLGFSGVELATYQNEFFFVCNATNGEGKAHELDGTKNLVDGSWYHVVATCDGSTEALWVNGVSEGTKSITSSTGASFVPDPSTPLMIGSGGEPAASYGNGWKGTIDDVAIYNEILPQSSIDAHFQTAYGTNATFGTNYPAAVLADSPTFYYRLNDHVSQTNAGYPANTFPVATNYGAVSGANGVYQPGTEPGVAGPSYEGFGASSKSVAINGWFGAVDVGEGNLPAALNPTGTSPLTLVSWFRGNIADAPGRLQNIVGHGGNSSYYLSLGQANAENHFSPGPASADITNAPLYQSNGFALNDGNWHMVAGVSDGTNDYLYLDGILAKSNNSVTGISIPGTTNDLLLGGDSQYTYSSWGTPNTIRDLDGEVAHVAFWTNALDAAQIQSLFNAAGVPASIRVQPIGATNNQGASVTVTATVTGSQPFTYQWYQNNAPVSGQTNAALSFASIPTNATGSYYLVAGNPYGPAVTSSVVSIFVYGTPSIVTEPTTTLDIFAGQSPVLSMSAAGAPPITYQWTSNGVVVSTAQTYTITGIENGGTYVGTAINADGSASTAPITLTVLPVPTAPYPAQVLSDHPIAFWRLDETSGDIAYDYVGGNNGIYSNVALAYAPSYNPVSDPSEGYAPYFGGLQTNDSYVGSIPTNISFTAPTNVNAEFSIEMWAQQYSADNDGGLAAIGIGYGGEEFALDSGGFDPAHDLRFYVNNAGDVNSGATSHVGLQDTSSMWHHVVAVCDEANKLVSLYIDGTNAASTAITTKSGIRSLTSPMSIGARISGNGDNNYDNQYFGLIDEVAVYNYALTSNQVAAHYLAAGIAPIITQLLPTGFGGTETTNVDATASFTVEATGTPPLYYFWTGPSGTVISTNQTLNLPDVQTSEQGLFSVIVSNAYGVTQPASAYLSVVLGPPQISQDISPLTQTVQLYAGEDQVSYTVVAIGSAPFSYQWYQNGTPISGATNQTYAFTALPGTNSYYVTVTNSYTASQNGGVPATSSTAQVIASAVPQLNPTNYPYKTKITFPGYSGTPLTNFPALITLSSSTLQGLDYTQFETNGADIRFTDASGTSILPSEIDEWNDNGVSTIWVMVPLLNGTNIWAYWGNTSSTNTPPDSTNVWIDSGYEIVYHLKETQPPYADSTGQYPATAATNGTATTITNGVVGHGQAFNGTTSILSAGPVTLSNQFTTYVWAYLSDSAPAQIQTLWCNQEGGYGNNGFAEFVNSYNSSDWGILMASGDEGSEGYQPQLGPVGTLHAGPFTAGTWHLLVISYDQPDQVVTCSLDGTQIGTGGCANDFALTNGLDLGAFLNPNFWWTGNMDEARIQYGVAGTNWIATTYANMANSSFVSLSALNQKPLLSIISVANSFMLSWPTNDGTFTLEATTNLASPSSWAPVSSPTPTIVGGNYEVTIPTTGTNEFYRLEGQ